MHQPPHTSDHISRRHLRVARPAPPTPSHRVLLEVGVVVNYAAAAADDGQQPRQPPPERQALRGAGFTRVGAGQLREEAWDRQARRGAARKVSGWPRRGLGVAGGGEGACGCLVVLAAHASHLGCLQLAAFSGLFVLIDIRPGGRPRARGSGPGIPFALCRKAQACESKVQGHVPSCMRHACAPAHLGMIPQVQRAADDVPLAHKLVEIHGRPHRTQGDGWERKRQGSMRCCDARGVAVSV